MRRENGPDGFGTFFRPESCSSDQVGDGMDEGLQAWRSFVE